jgi:predicted Zn finger-like uncharacterized protein
VQANCPKCAQKIVIDDARVPDRAFSVKCPKCQTSVKFAGKAAAAPASATPATASAPAPAPAPAPPAPEPPGGPGDEAMRAEMMEQVRREMALGVEPRPDAGRALVSLGDRGQAGSIALPLTRQGYHVDTVDNAEEAARLIEQGVYDLVATTRTAGQGGKETLYQRMMRLGPEARRRVFLVLVGDDFKTGDGTQAWVALADLVASPKDLGAVDTVLAKTIDERARMYQVFNDARKRFEANAP